MSSEACAIPAPDDPSASYAAPYHDPARDDPEAYDPAATRTRVRDWYFGHRNRWLEQGTADRAVIKFELDPDVPASDPRFTQGLPDRETHPDRYDCHAMYYAIDGLLTMYVFETHPSMYLGACTVMGTMGASDITTAGLLFTKFNEAHRPAIEADPNLAHLRWIFAQTD